MNRTISNYLANRFCAGELPSLAVKGISQARGQDKKNPIGFCKFNHAKFSSPLYAAMMRMKGITQ